MLTSELKGLLTLLCEEQTGLKGAVLDKFKEQVDEYIKGLDIVVRAQLKPLLVNLQYIQAMVCKIRPGLQVLNDQIQEAQLLNDLLMAEGKIQVTASYNDVPPTGADSETGSMPLRSVVPISGSPSDFAVDFPALACLTIKFSAARFTASRPQTGQSSATITVTRTGNKATMHAAGNDSLRRLAT